MRICSLLPRATEIAFALGLGDEVVAVTHECDYPPEAKKRRVVVKSVIDPERQDSGEIDRLVRAHVQKKNSIYTIDLPSFQAAAPDFIWSNLPAVKNDRVYAVNGSAYFNRSGPRLIDGVEILAQIIHPEIFPWQAPPEAAQRISME